MTTIDKPRKARLLVPAAKAKPSPAIGQALGQLGVNMMAFCKDFNNKTSHYTDEVPLRVDFTAFPDKTFQFVPSAPKSTWFLKRAAGIHVGAAAPNKQAVGTVHVKQIYEIAKIKKGLEPKLAKVPLRSYCKTLAATCGSMGVAVDTSRRAKPNKPRAKAKALPPPPEKGKAKKKK